MNRDELEGKATDVKGSIKEQVGEATDNERLRNEGQADQAAGETQEAYGKGKRRLGDAIEDLGERIKR